MSAHEIEKALQDYLRDTPVPDRDDEPTQVTKILKTGKDAIRTSREKIAALKRKAEELGECADEELNRGLMPVTKPTTAACARCEARATIPMLSHELPPGWRWRRGRVGLDALCPQHARRSR